MAETAPSEMTHEILGLWKLVSAVSEDVATRATTDVYGTNPVGYISYAPEGRMMVFVVRAGRPRPAGDVPTAAEADALFRSMIAYTGTYAIDGDTVTHRVDASWNELWTGTVQKRAFRLDRNRIELVTEVTPDPFTGRTSIRRMVWEKVA
jgi:Lipocalin-like domain